MLLYNITLSSQRIDNTDLLYFRTDTGSLLSENGETYISLKEGGYVSFDTFMNVFSYSKFLKYTNLNCVKITLKFKGKLAVSLVRCRTWRNIRSDFETEIIERKIVSSDEPSTTSFIWDFSEEPLAAKNLDRWRAVGKIDPAKAAMVGITGICYLHITSLEDGAKVYGGSYSTEITATNKVKVGIGICAYKREEYVKANIQMLNRMMKDYEGLSEELEVFIADNGGTLSGEIEETEQVHLFPNLNYGGSGGFTRTLMEIWYRRDQYTHALLMDDDVFLEPTTILKTLAVLRTLKEEFCEAHIGGAMLHISNPYYQFELGSVWQGDKAKSFNRHDITIKKKLLENEKFKPVNFNGWFFHCMPLSIIEKYGLPFPFFIKGDDIEYSLRSHAPIITMNGIGVWHEPYTAKYSTHLTYFDYRNKLVIQSINQPNTPPKKIMRIFISKTKFFIYRQRYDEAEFILLAMEDFLRGPDFFLQQKEDEKLKELLNMRTSFFYSKEDLEKQGVAFSDEEFRKKQKYTKKKFYQIIDKYTFNGILIPRFFYKRKLQTVDFGEKNIRFFCRWKNILQWDTVRNMGMITHDNFRKSFKLFLRLLNSCFKVKFNYKNISMSYIERTNEITSLKFWEKHLQLPSTNNVDVGFYPVVRRLAVLNDHEVCSEKLYICSTYYHVLITLLKTFSGNEVFDIAVCNDIPTGEQLAKRLSQCGLFGKVFYINQTKLPLDGTRNIIDAVFFQHRRRAKQIRPLLPFKLSEYKDIYIFHDATRIGKYLVDEKRKYHLIEDSLNFFKTLRTGPQAKNLHKRTWKYGIQKLLNMGYFPLGESKYLLDIEVNEKKDLQVYHKHIIEVPRSHLKSELSEKQRAVILDIFGCPSISINCSTALVLTEPLFQDRVVSSEHQQAAIYQKIIDELMKMEYEVIIKPHPRDKLNYQIFGCPIISRMFPTEMFSIMGYPPFPLAVAVTSSSLEQIDAQKKTYFKELLQDQEILKM